MSIRINKKEKPEKQKNSKKPQKIDDVDKWINSESHKDLVKVLVKMLRKQPYCDYAVLFFSKLFFKYKIFDLYLPQLKKRQIAEFVLSFKQSKDHLEKVQELIEDKKLQDLIPVIQKIIKKAEKSDHSDLIKPVNPKKLVSIIRHKGLNKVQEYFSKLKSKTGKDLLETLEYFVGYDDE